MFGIRYRYFFILLLSVYSYLNIRLTTGEKLLDFPIPQIYFFGLLSVVVLGVWELNRLVENRLDFLSSKVSHKIHPRAYRFHGELGQCNGRDLFKFADSICLTGNGSRFQRKSFYFTTVIWLSRKLISELYQCHRVLYEPVEANAASGGRVQENFH